MRWPIHSERMRPVAEAIAPLVASLSSVRAPVVPYYGPEGRASRAPRRVRRLLGEAFCFPTLWKDAFESMVAAGHRLFLEAGPGRCSRAWRAGSTATRAATPAGRLDDIAAAAGIVRGAMKTAVVTGGSRGIGRAICLELAAAGDTRIVVAYRADVARAEETVAELQRRGAEAVAVAADVRDVGAGQAPGRARRRARRRGRARQQRGRHQGLRLSPS
jgi:hypothetical protein